MGSGRTQGSPLQERETPVGANLVFALLQMEYAGNGIDDWNIPDE